jgi:hypothetical protein
VNFREFLFYDVECIEALLVRLPLVGSAPVQADVCGFFFGEFQVLRGLALITGVDDFGRTKSLHNPDNR